MAFRNIGLNLRTMTTADITALVGRFGPAGTDDVTGIKPGTTVFDSTVGTLKVFDGTEFVSTHGLPQAPRTVATLRVASAALKGSRSMVSDSSVTTFGSVVAGGGANIVPVYCDGGNWKVG